jgi:hypothetical protein
VELRRALRVVEASARSRTVSTTFAGFQLPTTSALVAALSLLLMPETLKMRIWAPDAV